MHKDWKWEWTTKEQTAFDAIKATMMKEPVLTHPDPTKTYYVKTDALGVAMGAIVSQQANNGRLHPITYMSESFSPAERNYNTHNKELWAIIQALENWRIHLEGTELLITVFTDHRNLEYWQQAQTFNQQHAQWYLILASYNFHVSYRPGKQSAKPDALSRRADYKDIPDEPQVMIPKEAFLAALSIEILPESDIQEDIKDSLHTDPSLEAVLEFITKDQSQTLASVRAKFKEYKWEDGLLWYQGRIVVFDDETIKGNLTSNFHDSPMAGHPGQTRSLELALRHYYWPGMKAWFNHYVDTCETCQQIRAPKGEHIPVQLLPVPSKPFEHISYDMIVKLLKSSGFDSILVVIDSLTKYGHFIPCKESMNTRELADLFIWDVWKLHRTPQSTVSDRGTMFNSKFLRALYKRLGIKPSFSSVYYP